MRFFRFVLPKKTCARLWRSGSLGGLCGVPLWLLRCQELQAKPPTTRVHWWILVFGGFCCSNEARSNLSKVKFKGVFPFKFLKLVGWQERSTFDHLRNRATWLVLVQVRSVFSKLIYIVLFGFISVSTKFSPWSLSDSRPLCGRFAKPRKKSWQTFSRYDMIYHGNSSLCNGVTAATTSMNMIPKVNIRCASSCGAICSTPWRLRFSATTDKCRPSTQHNDQTCDRSQSEFSWCFL